MKGFEVMLVSGVTVPQVNLQDPLKRGRTFPRAVQPTRFCEHSATFEGGIVDCLENAPVDGASLQRRERDFQHGVGFQGLLREVTTCCMQTTRLPLSEASPRR